MKTIFEITKKELLNLPVKDWREVKEYDSILIVNTRKKHDSGWAVMSIVGVNNQTPFEIAAPYCDDIIWKFISNTNLLRTNCAFKSGTIHVWGTKIKFRIGVALSSTEIEIFSIPNK